MKSLLPTLALAAALLLPACSWNIGACIRSSTALHIGGDTRHPIDGKVYHIPTGNWDDWSYAWVPEVTYRQNPDLADYWLSCWRPTEAFDIRPTGRNILVRFKHFGMEQTVEKIDALPEGAVPVPDILPHVNPSAAVAESLGDFPGEQATRGSLGAQLAAAPFDYVIDPALSVVTTPIFAVGAACFGGIIIEHGPAVKRWFVGDEDGEESPPAP